MNSELEDLELNTLLEELEKDSNEIDQLSLEMDQLCLEMDEIDNLFDQFNNLQAEKNGLKKLVDKKRTDLKLKSTIRNLKFALKTISKHFHNRYNYKKSFINLIQKFRVALVKFKTIQSLHNLDLNFKHLNDSFQNIKHKNHTVMLQPRLQSINSIEA